MPSESLHSLLDEPLPHRLYHHTKQSGLLGIVTHRELWATDLRYQNDGLELELALDLVKDIWPDVDPDGDAEPARDFALSQTEQARVYVASFSAEPDVLSQWLGYSGAGNGYALGFSPQSLRAAARTGNGRDWRLAKVCYDEHDQRAIVCPWVTEAVRKFTTEDWDEGPPFPPGGAELLHNVLRFGPLLKHKSFRQEREWRLISPAKAQAAIIDTDFEHDVLFREGVFSLVPFVKLPLGSRGNWGLEHVRVSPGVHGERRRLTAELFLRSKGESVPVEASEIPLRSEGI